MRVTTMMAAGWLLAVAALARADQQSVQVVREATAQDRDALYIGNRAPLVPSGLIKLPIGAIKPKGWLRHQLELERDGMVGHLAEISPYCKFEGNAWASPQGQGHSPWEDLPYWLKGYGDLGYVLNDEAIIRRGPPLDRRHACQPGARRLVRPALPQEGNRQPVRSPDSRRRHVAAPDGPEHPAIVL